MAQRRDRALERVVGEAAERTDEGTGADELGYLRLCPYCHTCTSDRLVICPSCDRTMPFVRPSPHYLREDRDERRGWARRRRSSN